MKYPTALLQRDRLTLPKERIRNHNFVYSRHKPSAEWNPTDGLPDFTKIKLDQSFNWCIYSIPTWTRFNDERKYLSDYAVAAFSVKTIRESQYDDANAQSQVLEIEHKPLPENYSHCEMVCLKKLDHTERRRIRMELRHGCKVPLQPNQTQGNLSIALDRFRMNLARITSRIL